MTPECKYIVTYLTTFIEAPYDQLSDTAKTDDVVSNEILSKGALIKLLFIILTTLLITLGSCAKPTGSESDIKIEESYEVKILDSCEYIYVSRRPWSAEFSLTHKGNCKYCLLRNQK